MMITDVNCRAQKHVVPSDFLTLGTTDMFLCTHFHFPMLTVYYRKIQTAKSHSSDILCKHTSWL